MNAQDLGAVVAELSDCLSLSHLLFDVAMGMQHKMALRA